MWCLRRRCARAFGGKVEGQTFGVATTAPSRLNLLRLEEDLSAAHLRLAATYIEHLDWANCIRRYDRPATLFYCDPPYWGTEGYGVGFPLEQYAKLADLARHSGDARGLRWPDRRARRAQLYGGRDRPVGQAVW